MENSNIGKRPIGKPKKRWVNAVEMNSREILKARNLEISRISTFEPLFKKIRGSTSGCDAIEGEDVCRSSGIALHILHLCIR
jgi:hypothetical protein